MIRHCRHGQNGGPCGAGAAAGRPQRARPRHAPADRDNLPPRIPCARERPAGSRKAFRMALSARPHMGAVRRRSRGRNGRGSPSPARAPCHGGAAPPRPRSLTPIPAPLPQCLLFPTPAGRAESGRLCPPASIDPCRRPETPARAVPPRASWREWADRYGGGCRQPRPVNTLPPLADALPRHHAPSVDSMHRPSVQLTPGRRGRPEHTQHPANGYASTHIPTICAPCREGCGI